MFVLTKLASQKRRVLATLLIFALSAGVLGGVLFYIDSIGPSVQHDMLDDVAVDAQVSLSSGFHQQNETSLADLQSTIREQNHVLGTEGVTLVQSYDQEIDDYRFEDQVYLGVGDELLSQFPGAFTILESTGELEDSSCYVETNTLSYLGLGIGDNFTAKARTTDESGQPVNITQSFEIVGTFESDLFWREGYGDQPGFTTLRMITTKPGLETAFSQLGHTGWESMRNQIWVDMDASAILSQQENRPAQLADDIGDQIEQSILPFGVVSQFELRQTLSAYETWSSTMSSLSLIFSVPTLTMAIMLVYYNATLRSDEQRRDAGTLKTRGATGWQVFRWVLLQSVAIGFVGSIAAVGTGMVSALLSGSVRTFLEFSFQQLSSFVLLVELDAIMFVFLFAFGLGVIVSIPMAVQALLMSPEEAHGWLERQVLATGEQLTNPVVDFVAVGASAYLLFPLIGNFGYASSAPQLRTFYFFVLVMVLMGMFVFSFARLLSRGGPRLKSAVFGRMQSDRYAPVSKVLSRNVKLFRKTDALGIVFIAMVFTAGIFSSLSAETGRSHTQHLYKFEVGADIHATVRSDVTNVTADLAEEITAIDGVVAASAVLETRGRVAYIEEEQDGDRHYRNQSITILGVQPEAWAQSAFWLDYFTKDHIPRQALQKLAESNQNVITSFKPVIGFGGGFLRNAPIYDDEVTVRIGDAANHTVSEYHIVDVMSTFYQGGKGCVPGRPDLLRSFVIMNLNHLQEQLNTTRVTSFYCNLDQSANDTAVLEEITALTPGFGNMESSEQRIQKALDSEAAQTIHGIYTLNVVFSFIYLTAGIAIVTVVRIDNLRKQLSMLRALGTDRGSIMGPLLADAVASVLGAAIIGSVVSLILVFFALQIPLAFLGPTSSLQWFRLPVRISVPIVLLTIIVAVTLVVVAVTVYVVTKSHLERSVAEEIQYVS
ncbi:MAG: ABC transporter permease [Promethearchaeati archaeon]